ncbi:MAG: hypothetical protein OES79_10135, partial [Planctomycetota bacterium]|nr:hypothetical protein [Planctomycetota bacterium]
MASPWKLELPQAVLTADSFGAVLTVTRPQQGLQSLRPFFERQEDVRLFQIRIGDGEPGELPVADAYTRLHDVIVSYAESAPAESAPSACGSQIYWRFLDGSRCD